MNESTVVAIVQKGLMTIVLVSAPPLLLGLAVGIIVSVFQAVTSIQEPTLAFVPKIIAVFLAIYIFGPWMMDQMMGYFNMLMQNMQSYIAY